MKFIGRKAALVVGLSLSAAALAAFAYQEHASPDGMSPHAMHGGHQAQDMHAMHAVVSTLSFSELQQTASDLERATPASTRVSSTRRSDCLSLVMTGTDSVVNISVTLPQRTPQATFLPNLRSASRAISIRRARVSSRNRLMRPSAAATASSASGSGSMPMIVISSRSTVTSAGPENHSSGRRPVNHARTSVLM